MGRVHYSLGPPPSKHAATNIYDARKQIPRPSRGCCVFAELPPPPALLHVLPPQEEKAAQLAAGQLRLSKLPEDVSRRRMHCLLKSLQRLVPATR